MSIRLKSSLIGASCTDGTKNISWASSIGAGREFDSTAGVASGRDLRAPPVSAPRQNGWHRRCCGKLTAIGPPISSRRRSAMLRRCSSAGAATARPCRVRSARRHERPQSGPPPPEGTRSFHATTAPQTLAGLEVEFFQGHAAPTLPCDSCQPQCRISIHFSRIFRRFGQM